MLGEYLTSFDGANVHSVLVIRHGTLVYEQYFTGEDEIWSEPIGPIPSNTTPSIICVR